MAAKQLTIEFSTWGGVRKGAGRKPTAERARAPHRRRDEVRPWQPVHVTLRMASHVWNLRSERSFAIVDRTLRAMRRRPDLRVVHFSVQGNHLHLLVEAAGTSGLSNGVRALSVRLARGLNRLMDRRGPVFEDRYHAHVLRSPTEVRNALRYVLGNHARHARAWGESPAEARVDPFSSVSGKVGREPQLALLVEPAVKAARTWLLRNEGQAPQ